MKLGLLPLLCLLALASCSADLDATFQPQIVVQGFIYANEPLDSIVVRRTLPIDTRSPNDRVGGAQVTLSDGDSTYQLAENTGISISGQYISTSPLMIQAGKTYSLTVVWNGTTVTAETTVPAVIHLDSVKLHGSMLPDTIIYDTTLLSPPMHLWWSSSPGCAGYGLETLSLDTARLDTIVNPVDKSLADSIAFGRYRFFVLSTDEDILWQQFRFFGPNVIRALALDRNYQDYILGLFLSGSQFNNSTLHVTGGLGVFGSAARASKFVYLK